MGKTRNTGNISAENIISVDISNDRIGIGSVAPQYTLDFGKTSASTIRLISESNGTTIRVGAGGNGNNNVTLLRVDSTGRGESDSATYGFSINYMGVRSGNSNSLSIFSDNQTGSQIEALTMFQDGKIGINSITPGYTLDVGGDINFSGSLYQNGVAFSAGGGGGSGTFDTGITTSIFVSVTSGVGINTAETNDIFVGPGIAGTTVGIAYSFPSTAGKKYVIESIHITNTFTNELYFVGRHDFSGGSAVPLAQRVIVPYQGATQFLDQPIIANPSDILRFQALSDTTSTATGIDGGLDAFIIYSEKDDTNYIGTGKTVTTAGGTQIFQASSNPAMLQSLKLCNYDLNTDIDASISIYRGSLASGVRLGYLAYNITVPKNSVIEVLEKPVYLAASDSIVGGASAANVLAVTLSGKYIV